MIDPLLLISGIVHQELDHDREDEDEDEDDDEDQLQPSKSGYGKEDSFGNHPTEDES
tara:strand:+ start:171 stop:341 length:171 start_codon:yes stop_codon:yes gene_type:complete